MFSPLIQVRKFRAFTAIAKACITVRNFVVADMYYEGNAGHEKLQIIYANIRV
jgi:hypothetical protein